MPFKDPEARNAYMRQYKAKAKKTKSQVNPTPEVNPVPEVNPGHMIYHAIRFSPVLTELAQKYPIYAAKRTWNRNIRRINLTLFNPEKTVLKIDITPPERYREHFNVVSP
jgi:hypothetical protein